MKQKAAAMRRSPRAARRRSAKSGPAPAAFTDEEDDANETTLAPKADDGDDFDDFDDELLQYAPSPAEQWYGLSREGDPLAGSSTFHPDFAIPRLPPQVSDDEAEEPPPPASTARVRHEKLSDRFLFGTSFKPGGRKSCLVALTQLAAQADAIGRPAQSSEARFAELHAKLQPILEAKQKKVRDLVNTIMLVLKDEFPDEKISVDVYRAKKGKLDEFVSLPDPARHSRVWSLFVLSRRPKQPSLCLPLWPLDDAADKVEGAEPPAVA
jgi:hypothetical protein